MSRTTLVVTLMLAVGLAAAGYFLLGEGAGAAGGVTARVLNFDPAEITEIVIRRDGGAGETLVRSEDAAAWELVTTGDAVESRWPLMTPQVRGLLRVLADLPGERAEPAAGDRFPTSVTLKTRQGRAIGFEVGDAALSGRVVLRTFDDAWAAHWVDAQVESALRHDGVMMWRDRTLLRRLGPDTSRVALRSPTGAIELGRVLGRWGLTEPVSAAASQQAVERLVAALAALRAQEFLDRVPGDALANPKAVITVTLTSRDPSGAATESTRTVEIGEASDLAGARLYVRVREEGPAGARGYTATLDAAALAGLTTDPGTLVDPRSATFPAADVGGFVLDGRALVRTPAGWSQARGAGADEPLSRDDSAVISGFVSLVTERAAARVELQDPSGPGDGHDLELRSLGGEPLAQLVIAPAAAADMVAIRDGEVWRVYTAPEDVEAVRAALALLNR